MIRPQHADFLAQPVSDVERAAEFYGGTLGLAHNPATGPRWMEFETGNLTIGLSTFGPGLAFRVEDVAAARSTLESGGVEFAMDTFDSGVCHGAPFMDPDGNNLLFHRRYAPPDAFEPPAMEVQRTDFIGISVTDRDRAGGFYRDTLGIPHNQLSDDDWPEFELDNVGVVLSTPEQRNEPEFKPNDFTVALRVADVGASMERLAGAGVEFHNEEPFDTGVCHMAFFNDPDGNSLMLHRRYAPFSDGSAP